jgi:hypothetical protein
MTTVRLGQTWQVKNGTVTVTVIDQHPLTALIEHSDGSREWVDKLWLQTEYRNTPAPVTDRVWGLGFDGVLYGADTPYSPYKMLPDVVAERCNHILWRSSDADGNVLWWVEETYRAEA